MDWSAATALRYALLAPSVGNVALRTSGSWLRVCGEMLLRRKPIKRHLDELRMPNL